MTGSVFNLWSRDLHKTRKRFERGPVPITNLNLNPPGDGRRGGDAVLERGDIMYGVQRGG